MTTDIPKCAEWYELNERISRVSTLAEAEAMLAEEKAGKVRLSYLLRIVNRINRITTTARLREIREYAAAHRPQAVRAEAKKRAEEREAARELLRRAREDASYLRERERMAEVVKKHKRKARARND